MSLPYQVGITGGIGAGKSLICRIFVILGIPVYDADSAAKRLMTEDPVLVEQIKAHFGEKSYLPSQQLDRQYLAQQIFQDPEKTKLINALVHPQVGKDYLHWVAKQNSPYVIREAALLFESGTADQLDSIIVVMAPENIRKERVILRDANRSLAQIDEIIQKQMAPAEMQKRADHVIKNDGKTSVLQQVLRLHEMFISSSSTSTAH